MHLHNIPLTFSPTQSLQWIDVRITDCREASSVTWSCILHDTANWEKQLWNVGELPAANHHNLIQKQRL